MAKESMGVEKQKIPAAILKIPTSREIHQYLNNFWFKRISCNIFISLYLILIQRYLGGIVFLLSLRLEKCAIFLIFV